MVLLGLLLAAAAAVFGTELVLSNTQTTTGEAFNQTVAGMTAGEFFLVGAGTGLALCLGLLMIFGGLGRSRARRSRAKHAVAESRQEVRATESELTSLADENERLRRELDEERRNRETMGGVAVPPALADTTYEPYPGAGNQPHSEPVQDEGRDRSMASRMRGEV